MGRVFELATTIKKCVKNEILLDYKREFELRGSMIFGIIELKTNIRFKKMDDFESYIKAIDIEYDIENIIFTGYVTKLNTPQFKVVNQSAYAKGINYMQEIVEYHGQICCNPTSGMCFTQCIN